MILIKYLNDITNSIEHNLSWGANSHSSCQEIPHLLSNPKVHYFVHKSKPLVPILSQIHPETPSYPISLRSILILVFHLRLSLPNCLFPSGSPTKILYSFLISPMLATCPAQLILLDLIIIMIFSQAYNLWSSSLCSFLPLTYKYCRHYPVFRHS